MAGIVIDRVTKMFGEVVGVDDVSVEAADGEFLVLVGPSGCGKSTLLRIVAGLEEVTSGAVRVGDVDVTDLPPKARDVAMVFQNYALYPHMTVEQNIGFGLRLRHLPKETAQVRVREAADLLGIGALLRRKPHELSGGQRQRVAMGRVIVREPKAFLMDEPLSNLDAKLRVQMRAELARIRDSLRTTTLYVTHDQVEAMTLGDRVAVLRDGVLQQIDRPQALFASPANLFVAAFLGSPSMNLVYSSVDRTGSGAAVQLGEATIPVPADVDLSGFLGGRVVLGVRPSDLECVAGPADGRPLLTVVADVVENLGTGVNVLFDVAADPVDPERLGADGGDMEASAASALGRVSALTASVDSRNAVRVGDRITLTVAPESLHFFDPETGRAIARTGAVAALVPASRAGR